MTYKRTLSYATRARMRCARRKGYAARTAGQPRTANPYKNKWDRDNWLTGWWDAEIKLTKDEETTDDNFPF